MWPCCWTTGVIHVGYLWKTQHTTGQYGIGHTTCEAYPPLVMVVSCSWSPSLGVIILVHTSAIIPQSESLADLSRVTGVWYKQRRHHSVHTSKARGSVAIFPCSHFGPLFTSTTLHNPPMTYQSYHVGHYMYRVLKQIQRRVARNTHTHSACSVFTVTHNAQKAATRHLPRRTRRQSLPAAREKHRFIH